MNFYSLECTNDKSGNVYFAFEYQISSRLIGPLQVSLSFLLVFYQSSNVLKLTRAPATSFFVLSRRKMLRLCPNLALRQEYCIWKGKYENWRGQTSK